MVRVVYAFVLACRHLKTLQPGMLNPAMSQDLPGSNLLFTPAAGSPQHFSTGD